MECGLLIYKSIIRPVYYSYANVIWGTSSKTNINKVQRLQNKILRILCNAPWKKPAVQEFSRKCAKNYLDN